LQIHILPYRACMKFYYTTLIKYTAAAILLGLFTIQGQAQVDLSSPYSIFGPGIPHQGVTVSQAGMGGSGMAFIELYRMNTLNPAALAYHLEPIFETSGVGTFSTFKTNTGSFKSRSFELNNLSLTFPIKRGVWGLTVGLEPYTTVGYDVNSASPDPSLTTTPVTKYSGDGGINKGYLGMAYKIYDKVDSAGNTSGMAIGSNFNYLFGTVDHNRQIAFPEEPAVQGLRIKESVLMRDVNFDFGVQYHTNLIKRSATRTDYLKLNIGATYSTGVDINSQKNSLVHNFNVNPLAVGDTLSILEMEKGHVTLPSRIVAGVGLDYISKKRRRYRFAIDYSTQQWSQYDEVFADQQKTFQFRDNHILSTGLEYTPSLGSTKYLRTVEYRVGFKFEETNIDIDGTAINDVGMSFGLTLPLHHRRGLTKSAFHISGQYGTYGTTDNGLIQEDYFKLYVGFSFTPHFRNRWFVQPKYD